MHFNDLKSNVVYYLPSMVLCVKCPPSQLHYSFARVLSASFSHNYHQWCERMLLRHAVKTVLKEWMTKSMTTVCGRPYAFQFNSCAYPWPSLREILHQGISMKHVIYGNNRENMSNLNLISWVQISYCQHFSSHQLSSVMERPDVSCDEEWSRTRSSVQDTNVQVCWQLLHGCFPALQCPDLS